MSSVASLNSISCTVIFGKSCNSGGFGGRAYFCGVGRFGGRAYFCGVGKFGARYFCGVGRLGARYFCGVGANECCGE